VGTNTNPVGAAGFARFNFDTNTKPNAIVLPDPVGALPQTSLPARPSGMVIV
jgi:hypothetical protein